MKLFLIRLVAKIGYQATKTFLSLSHYGCQPI